MLPGCIRGAWRFLQPDRRLHGFQAVGNDAIVIGTVRNVKTVTTSARWRVSPAVLALGLGIALGRPGFGLLQPQLLDESGQIETSCEVALLVSLFCVGLRLQLPFEWHRWRLAARLSTVSLLATWVLAAVAAKVLFDVNVVEALLIASILAPTDGVLASDIQAATDTEQDAATATTLAAEGAFNNGIAVAAVVFVLGLMGLEEKSSGSVGWLVLKSLWEVTGGIAAGAAVGIGMSRWIALLDFDRQTDLLETMVVFAAAALAYGGAEAIHTSGFLGVVAAGVALGHGGRLHSRRTKRALAPRVFKIAARVERLATLPVVVLLGALSPEMDVRLRVVVFAVILLALVRPLAVRLGLNVLAPATPQRKQLEWIGVRGVASLYCLAFAINHGLDVPFGRQLAGISLLVIAGSIIAHGVTGSPVRKASPGALSS